MQDKRKDKIRPFNHFNRWKNIWKESLPRALTQWTSGQFNARVGQTHVTGLNHSTNKSLIYNWRMVKRQTHYSLYCEFCATGLRFFSTIRKKKKKQETLGSYLSALAVRTKGGSSSSQNLFQIMILFGISGSMSIAFAIQSQQALHLSRNFQNHYQLLKLNYDILVELLEYL